MDLLSSLEAQGVSDVYLVGGTGFYFQAIEKGMFSVEKVDPAIAAQLMVEAGTAEGLLRLHRELENADPASAERIHRNDQYRIVRALEIVRGTGRRPSDLLQEKQTGIEPFPYPLRKLGVHWERSELHTRIHRRVKQMLKQGFIDEVVSLNKMNLQNWAPMQSVGYKEVQQYLVGEIKTHDALEEKILISTRQLAKRQVTWFRRDAEIDWVSL
jgi:tRNA dimethylallyltransferase